MSSSKLPNFFFQRLSEPDKYAMLNNFNEHFITAGHLFDSLNSDFKTIAWNNEPAAFSCTSVDCCFHFDPLSFSYVRSKKKKKLQLR